MALQKSNSRRRFLAASAIGAAASLCASPIRARGILEKPTVLGIGAGGKGRTDLEKVSQSGFDVIALADIVDTKRLGQVVDKRTKGQAQVRDSYPNAQFGTDYREMIAQLGDRIDAVVVSTPDHHHFHACVQAMQAGKHVYCQKPLTHSIWEARMLTELAQKSNVKTQMGNQAHAENHMRRCVELVRAGIIGKVKAIHTWTNRPIWAQGFAAPPDPQPVPDGIDWNQWVGPAPAVDYSPRIAPFAWRGWWDYGTGALGDMACHIMDLGYWAMNPAPALDVIAEQNGATELSPPINSKITWNFPENAYSATGGFQIHWYDGYVNAKFDRASWSLKKQGEDYNHPDDAVLEGMDFSDFGSVVVGEEGKLFFNRSKPNWILKVGQHIETFKMPAETLPRASGEDNYREWYDAVQGTVVEGQSNFGLAGRMTEAILLGVIAQRAPGKKLHWNATDLRIEGHPELQKYIRRDYATGWQTKELFGI